jgi:hypothetical protein
MTTSNSFSDTYQSADATVIDYETTGAGAPLVLLHSGMMSREDMRVQIEYFSNFLSSNCYRRSRTRAKLCIYHPN